MVAKHWLSLEAVRWNGDHDTCSPCLEESRLIHRWAALSCSALQKRRSGPALGWHSTKCHRARTGSCYPPCHRPQTTQKPQVISVQCGRGRRASSRGHLPSGIEIFFSTQSGRDYSKPPSGGPSLQSQEHMAGLGELFLAVTLFALF